MPSIATAKSELRQRLRAQRRSVTSATRTAAGPGLARQLQRLPGWHGIDRLALYLPADGEIDTAATAALALAQGKRLYLPVIQADKTLLFAPWRGTVEELHPNQFGIGEPESHGTSVPASTLDCVCLPLVAWSPDGSRLGMGGGYYDRSLAACESLLKVGLGFEMQRQERLPSAAWDLKVDYVATELALHPRVGSVTPGGG